MGRVKIGLIASLSGANEKIGQGILDSLQFVLADGAKATGARDRKIELIVKDDKGSSSESVRCARELLSEGCVAFIGPCDSHSMHELLETTEFDGVAILATLPTRSELSRLGKRNFFRLTSPDIFRAEMLVRQIGDMMPRRTIQVFASAGPANGYSQSLQRDVISVCDKLGVKYTARDFSTGRLQVDRPPKRDPILICAGSADASLLLQNLRSHRVRNQAFAFGSNTNFLNDAAVGLIVVCDLDRHDANPTVRNKLEAFFKSYRSSLDPSIPTMNAGAVLSSVARDLAEDSEDVDIGSQRRKVISLLANKTHEGVFGPISFDDHGEMAGFEQLSILRVNRSFGRFGFVGVSRKDKSIQYQDGYYSRVTVAALAIAGSIASIIALAIYLLGR